VSGFFPVVMRTTRPPMKKARIVVRTGTTTPPALCQTATRLATLGA
jgi:hypothetical protein